MATLKIFDTLFISRQSDRRRLSLVFLSSSYFFPRIDYNPPPTVSPVSLFLLERGFLLFPCLRPHPTV